MRKLAVILLGSTMALSFMWALPGTLILDITGLADPVLWGFVPGLVGLLVAGSISLVWLIIYTVMND